LERFGTWRLLPMHRASAPLPRRTSTLTIKRDRPWASSKRTQTWAGFQSYPAQAQS